MSNRTLLVLNGPGLGDVRNFAGDTFGIESLEHIETACNALCTSLGVELDFRQTDDQDQMIDWIRNEADGFGALIINQLGCADKSPVNYTKYVADLDVLASLSIPVTEIHLINVFRYDPGAFTPLQGPSGKTALVCGLGLDSYRVAIRAAARLVVGSDIR